MKKQILFILFLIIAGYKSVFSQTYQIENISTTPTITTCAQGAEYTFSITNQDVNDLNNLNRTLTLPQHLVFNWNTVPVGILLSYGSSASILNIAIPIVAAGETLSFTYTIGAGCGVSSLTDQAIVFSDGTGLDQNTHYSVTNSGSMNTPLLTFDSGFHQVNGQSPVNPSDGWRYDAYQGETFTRSYKIQNASGSIFNGFINYNRGTSTSLINLTQVDYFIDLDGNGNINTPETLQSTTAFVNFANGIGVALSITNLQNTQSVIITEHLNVVNCLGAGSDSYSLNFSYGCSANDVCNGFSSFPIILSTQGKQVQSDIDIVPESEIEPPVCHYNSSETTHRVLKFINKGTGPAILDALKFAAENIAETGYTFTLIPAGSVTISVNDPAGNITYTKSYSVSDAEINSVVFPNPSSYNYPKCVTGPVLSFVSNFLHGYTFLPQNILTVEWDEVNCCAAGAAIPDINKPGDWQALNYFAQAFRFDYSEQCSNIILSRAFNAYDGGQKQISLAQTLLPYQPRLTGGQRVPAAGGPINKFMGQTTPVEIENFDFNNTLTFSDQNSFLEVEIQLQGGLTLTQPNATYDNLLSGPNGNIPYAVTLHRQQGAFTYDLLPVITSTSVLPNQTDDLNNEVWTFQFALNDPELLRFKANVGYDPATDPASIIHDFIKESYIRYTVRGVCTDLYPESHFYTSVFFIPGDENGVCSGGCRLPLNTISDQIIVTCPGCINPGIILSTTSAQRTTLGAIDNNEDGIDDGSGATDNRRKDFATVGDVIELKQAFTFYPGGGTNGFVNGDLQTIKGITLNTLYALVTIPTGTSVIGASFGGVALSSSDFIQVNGTDVVVKITEPHFVNGPLPVSGVTSDIGELSLNIRVNDNLSSGIGIQQIKIQGILTDKDVDISTPSNIPSTDGTCNGLSDCVACKDVITCPGTCMGTCTSVFNDIIQIGNSYNFYCEPGSAANFLFIPIVVTTDAFDQTNSDDACNKVVEYRALLNHDKVNAFPNEYRTYGSDIKLKFNIADGFAFNQLQLMNQLTSGEEDAFVVPNITAAMSPGEGQNLSYDVIYHPFDGIANQPGNIHFHHDDEKVFLTALLSLKPSVCGQSSKNGKYSNNPQINALSGIFEYPQVDLVDFNVQSKPQDVNATFVHYRPFINLSAVAAGANTINFSGATATANLHFSNPELTDPTVIKDNNGNDVLDPNRVNINYALNGSNTFFTVESLPPGVTLTDADANNIVKVGTVNGGSTKDFALNFSYNCKEAIDDFVTIYYGWNCDGYPLNINEVNSSCSVGSLIYKLTAPAVSLSGSWSSVPPAVSYCEEMTYSLKVSSTSLGKAGNFSNSLYLPVGMVYVPGSLSIDGVAQPLLDPITMNSSNQNALIWTDIYPNSISGGESFILSFKLKALCEYNGGFIQDTATGVTYCGTSQTIALPPVKPTLQINTSQYDNLKLTSTCSNVGSYTTIFSVTNPGSTTQNQNTLSVTLPSNVTVVSGSTTAGYTSSGNVLTWTLPVIAVGGVATFDVYYTLTGTINCDQPIVLSGKINGTPKVACSSVSGPCNTSRVLDSISCSTAIDKPVVTLTGPIQSCLRESIVLTASVTGGTGTPTFTWYKVIGGIRQLLSGPPASAATYTYNNFDGTTLFEVEVNRGGCSDTARYTVTLGDPDYCCIYKLGDISINCSTQLQLICVPLTAVRNVPAGIIGMDFCLKYDPTVMTYTGPTEEQLSSGLGLALGPVVTNVGNGSKNYGANYAAYNDVVNGVLRISIFYTGSGQTQTNLASFYGNGTIICLNFSVLPSTSHVGMFPITMCSVNDLQEAYTLTEKAGCWKPGSLTIKTLDNAQGKLINPLYGSDIKGTAFTYGYATTSVTAVGDDCDVQNLIPATRIVGTTFSVPVNGATKIKLNRDIFDALEYPIPLDKYILFVNGGDTWKMDRITTMDPVLNSDDITKPTNSLLWYSMTAADVNMNGHVRANDISLVQERITRNIPQYPQVWNDGSNVPSLDWRFVDASTVATDPTFTRSTAYPNASGQGFYRENVPQIPLCLPTYRTCTGQTPELYYGVMLGDVFPMRANNTQSPSPRPGVSPYLREGSIDSSSITIDAKHAQYLGNNIYRVPVIHHYNYEYDDRLFAIDLLMDYDQEKISINNVLMTTATTDGGASMMWNNVEEDQFILTSYTTMDSIVANSVSYYLDIEKYTDEPFTKANFGMLQFMMNGEVVKARIETGETSDNTTSGETQTKINPHVSVIPNPAIGAATIDYAISNNSDDNRLVVTDVLGRIVKSFDHLSDFGMLDMNTEDLAGGMYIVTLKGDNGFKLSSKFQVIK